MNISTKLKSFTCSTYCRSYSLWYGAVKLKKKKTKIKEKNRILYDKCVLVCIALEN